MKKWRRRYYDFFSLIYDRLIALHSRDRQAFLRDFLLKKAGVGPETKLLDLCTGTGAVALAATKYVSERGLIVGVDFSWGMLKRAKIKAQRIRHPRLFFVLADVGRLPLKSHLFDVVTCSHAMYELEPRTREATLKEIRRVLKPAGLFAMMEHTEPQNPLIRLLYHLRLLSLGSRENRRFARDERPYLARYFSRVERLFSPTGNSKILLAYA